MIPEMQVRLLDPDTGADITAPGVPGVPAGKGPALCLGYYDDPPRTRELFTADGWMLMGDLVTIDADGYLTVVGRTSDIIIRGGKNISAAQVEDEVASHPAVALCAAVAVPDADLRRAGVRLRRAARGQRAITLDDLRAHLDARGTGKELWPERLVVLDALPRSSGGKVAKGELRARGGVAGTRPSTGQTLALADLNRRGERADSTSMSVGAVGGTAVPQLQTSWTCAEAGVRRDSAVTCSTSSLTLSRNRTRSRARPRRLAIPNPRRIANLGFTLHL